MPKVLIACEESQVVCKAFREKGIEAYSCDILPCSGGRPEWHIQGDCVPIAKSRCGEARTQSGDLIRPYGWDLIIAHPPCTYLTTAGAVHLYGKKHNGWNEKRYEKGLNGKEFFLKLFNSDCKRICVENPVPMTVFNLPPRTQEIQPFQFGHSISKKTCLWLKGLPLLRPTNIVEKTQSCSQKACHEWYTKGGKDRQKKRNATFQGIADAMAEQWGEFLLNANDNVGGI